VAGPVSAEASQARLRPAAVVADAPRAAAGAAPAVLAAEEKAVVVAAAAPAVVAAVVAVGFVAESAVQ